MYYITQSTIITSPIGFNIGLTNVNTRLKQRCFDVVSGTEYRTSDFVSFSTSDQRYFNVDPQRWNNVDPTLKCWLGRKIKIAGSYEDKPLLALRKLRHRLSFVSLHPYLEAMLWSESWISRIFLKPNRFWLQKMREKYSLTSERNV